MSQEPTGVQEQVGTPTCYRHPDRETYIRCQRCDRPICPDCMRQAAVGFQCPDCVREGARTTRQGRTPYGGLRKPPLVTPVLIGLNVLVFLAVQTTGGGRSRLLERLWLLPDQVAVRDGAGLRLVDGVADGAVWQLLTAMFTHVALWHIAFNMLALWVLGQQLEPLLGRARFLALYLLSGLVGSATVYWLAGTSTPTVGASGAIFGLMATLLVVAIKARGDVRSLMTLIGINVVITVIGAGFISWQGHLGGFVGGLALSAVLVYAPRQHRTAWQLAGFAVVSALVVLAVVTRTAQLAG